MDRDSASLTVSLTIEIRSAVLQRESIDNRVASLSRIKADYRIGVSPINNRDLRPAFTPDSNGLPSKVDIFEIGSGRDQHRIAVVRDIDGRLNGWLTRRHTDSNGCPDCNSNLRRRILHISAVVDRSASDRHLS